MAEKQDYCRIPLSLKVDKSDSLYQNLIAPARDAGRLTTLIIELLRGYYENEFIRDYVDRHMKKEGELQAVQEQIERMLREHTKNIAQTQALEFEAQQASRGVSSENGGISIDDEGTPKESETLLEILSMVQTMQHSMMQNNNMSQQAMGMPMMYNYGTTPYMQPMGYMPQGFVPMYMQGMPQQPTQQATQQVMPQDNLQDTAQRVERPVTNVVNPTKQGSSGPVVSSPDLLQKLNKSENTTDEPVKTRVKDDNETRALPINSTMRGLSPDSSVENPFEKTDNSVKPAQNVATVSEPAASVVKTSSGLIINKAVQDTPVFEAQKAVVSENSQVDSNEGSNVNGGVTSTDGAIEEKPKKKRRPSSFDRNLGGLTKTS